MAVSTTLGACARVFKDTGGRWRPDAIAGVTLYCLDGGELLGAALSGHA